MTFLAVALWFVASSLGGGGHGRLPVDGGVKRVSANELRLGFARVLPWQWSMWAEARPWSSSRDRVCFLVDLLGPLAVLPNGSAMGPETGGKRCGPIKSSRGAVVTMPTKEGSQTLPTGETESWQSFDVGIAAYPTSVSQVRLVFSDGGSEVLRARAVPGRVRFRNAESFHYAVFAVNGCISEVQGLAKGRVVARFGEQECDSLSE